MSFDWGEYLTLAKELAGQETQPSGDEAKLRTAISRAYYSAFHSAQTYVKQQGERQPVIHTEGSHERVIKWFIRRPENKYRSIGLKLQNLKDDRVLADYNSRIAKSPTAIASKAVQALRDAEMVITWVNKL